MGRFMFSFSVIITLFVSQTMAISPPFARKLMIESVAESKVANPPFSKGRIAELFEEGENETGAEAPESSKILKMRHHHNADKSVAGGGVIIGGLVTATFAAVYCYIRVTRKKENM